MRMNRLPVFIDTCTYEYENFMKSSALAEKLIDFSDKGYIQLYITSITRTEVTNRINAVVDGIMVKAKEFYNSVMHLSLLDPFELKPLDKQVLTKKQVEINSAFRISFEDFCKAMNCEEIPLGKIDFSDIMTDYFNGKPPFGKKKKKHEFPDAIVLKTLSEFSCSKDVDKFHEISKDNDFSNLEHRYDELFEFYPTIGKFVAYILKSEDTILYDRSLKLVDENMAEIKSAIEQEIKDTYIVFDDRGDDDEFEVESVKNLNTDLLELTDIGPYSVSVVGAVRAVIKGTATVVDEDSSYYDKEDDEWIVKEYIEVEIERPISLETQVNLEIADDRVFVEHVLINNNRSISISFDEPASYR